MLAARFGYMLALLALGALGRSSGVVGPQRRDRLVAFAFYVALPALVFGSTHDRPPGEVFSPVLVAGLWVVVLGMVGLSLLVHRNVDAASTRSVATVQSYHSNMGFLGLPLVAATFGDLAAAKGSVLLGIGALTQVPLTVVLLVALNDLDVSVRGELRTLLANPVILSLLAGLAFAALELPVPTAATRGIDLLSELALPVALVCVGASLDVRRADPGIEGTPTVVALKLLVMPALAWLVFASLGADQSTLRAGVLMLGMPTAVSTFVYATELGGDDAVASRNVLATTVLSAASLFVLVRLLA